MRTTYRPKSTKIHLHEIIHGMYGLPQSGMLATKLLNKHLKEYDFFEVPHTPGLFTHKTRLIWFTLCLDNFGVKYVGKEHVYYLMSVLKQFYNMEERGVILRNHPRLALRRRLCLHFYAKLCA